MNLLLAFDVSLSISFLEEKKSLLRTIWFTFINLNVVFKKLSQKHVKNDEYGLNKTEMDLIKRR